MRRDILERMQWVHKESESGVLVLNNLCLNSQA